jgi:CMP-N-acetylneuraminic acid synthetase
MPHWDLYTSGCEKCDIQSVLHRQTAITSHQHERNLSTIREIQHVHEDEHMHIQMHLCNPILKQEKLQQAIRMLHKRKV